ncbi:hypothetical protein [Halorussus caseinilyticus]|uniref:Uncharacterized protein n=1 Tax=Halorussus caseinilyticus TaxID=3034025 RepID=A0ABD5WL32_9EURY
MSHALGDTATFDRMARLYDWIVPAPDSDEFREALAFADRTVERVLDVGGGTGRGRRRSASASESSPTPPRG